MISYHIHIEGQVQGVGFRPYVWRMAKKFGLTGWVSNGVDGVHIEICGNEKASGKFCHDIIRKAPENARVVNHTMFEIEPGQWKDFQIRESETTGTTNLLVTPDMAICKSCKEEIISAKNRRYNYAFTTCTNCGPRYSIIQKLPYDRNHTTMDEFNQCPDCLNEFNEPANKRYYSQTNSCPACAVKVTLLHSSGQLITVDPEEVFRKTSELLKHGEIVAMKGIGGYLLLCDAANSATIDLLRTRKNRPTKPLALLYPSLEALRRDAFFSEAQADALMGKEAPIVLVKSKPGSPVALRSIAPGLDHIGVMMPYTPLMAILMEEFAQPLVATSGNQSGSPIFYREDDAIENLQGIADYFLINNREIVVPQDDSVIRFTQDDQKIILRRSRGLAPTFLPHPFSDENKMWLAMGSDIKSAFAILHQNNVYVSQFLGDLENYYTQVSFTNTLNHWQKLLGDVPMHIIIDKHPVYYSSLSGKRMASDLHCSISTVQHHEAHFAAVLAENNLLESSEPVLGVIWDGTGWGNDGNIWGGEFFKYEENTFRRVGHLDYFDHFLGDKVSREPRLCALSLCKGIPEAESMLKPKFAETEWVFYNKMLSQPNRLQTSSVGRLFDAVASLLGLCERSTYEGEAALYVETLASQADEELLQILWPEGKDFSLHNIMTQIIRQLKSGVPKENIAFHFHLELVNWIGRTAARQQTRRLAFSGGVFQNAMLVHLIQEHLGDDYQLYFHHQLSPNDENIGLGQLAWHYIREHVKSQRKMSISKSEFALSDY